MIASEGMLPNQSRIFHSKNTTFKGILLLTICTVCKHIIRFLLESIHALASSEWNQIVFASQPLTDELSSFAWAEMRMVAANVFSRFDVVEVPGQSIDYRQYITMQFDNGSWRVALKPRY
jgi:hypothetical protein